MHDEEIPLEAIVPIEKNVQNETTKKNNYFLYIIAAIANLLSFATGSTITWVTPVIPKLQTLGDYNPLRQELTPNEIGWIASCVPLGAALGPLITGKLADKLGRKPVLLLIGGVYTVSLLIVAFAKTIILFYIARFLTGLALGATFAVLPMYLVEISENHNRGTLGCSVNFFVAIGFNFSLIIGPYLTINLFSIVSLTPLLIFLPSFFLLGPESPAFLASSNPNKLFTNLTKLRQKNPEEIQSEIKLFLDYSHQTKNGILDLIRIKNLRKALLICLGLIILQQLAGVGAIFSYMQTIFESAKVKIPPKFCTVIVGTFQILGTIVSTMTVDRAGRKILLLGSSLGSCVTLLALGVYFYLKTNNYKIEGISWLPVSSLVIFMVAFSVGLGAIPWVIVSELFPSSVRPAAASLTSVICFVTNFLVTVSFPSLSLHLGISKCFFIFSLICFTGSVFIFWILPETKGKNFAQIQKLLGKNP